MTTKQCKLIVHDQVNVSFAGLDPKTRRECSDKLKFFIHAARHMPAYKLGRWDGCVRYFQINGNTYYNLLDQVLPTIVDSGYDIEIDDQRPTHEFDFPIVDEDFLVNNLASAVWPVGHPAAGQPIKLRDYQVTAINTFLANPQSIQELATGSGKTLTTATLSFVCQKYGRSIVIVPNKSLVDQTESDYKLLGLDVGVYYGDRKDVGKTHTICTWQSLDRMIKNEKEGKPGLGITEFSQGVICVIIDEAHGAKAEVVRSLLCGVYAGVPIRWGLTGTVPREPHEACSLLASLGPVVGKLAARELMDKGVLANCHVHMLQLMDTVEYPSYHEEYAYLVSDSNRLDWLSELVNKTSLDGNTLILVNRVDTGTELEARIKNSRFVYGGVAGKDRKEAYDLVTTGDNEKIIATYGVAAVGINIPRLFNVILFEPGKSHVRVIQSIGRGIRKAKDKNKVDIYDICSTCKYAAKHVTARKKLYKEAQYNFTIEKIDYLSQLAAGHITLKN